MPAFLFLLFGGLLVSCFLVSRASIFKVTSYPCVLLQATCLATDSFSHVCPNSSIIKYADYVSIFHFLRSSADDHLQEEWDQRVKNSARIFFELVKYRIVFHKTFKNALFFNLIAFRIVVF